MRTRAKAADPTAFDLPFLATTFDFPEPELQTLLDAPTTELVKSFLASLTLQGQDIEAAKAEKLKVDVELENTIRTSEAKVKAQKSAVAKHVKEVETLRTQLNESEKAREALAVELDQLRSNTSSSSAETSLLRQRIETLERSNRDALMLVESKTAEKDRVASELSEQHSKLIGLRREISQLEERSQSLENAASSQKFKEQSMQQEIDLLKRNNEWSSNELQTRSQEHAKFRKERNARIAALQRELEDSNSSVDTLKRADATLRKRLEEVQAKADEAFTRIASLQDEFSRKEQDLRVELDSTKRLADLQAQNAATHKARLQDVQGQVDEIKDQAAEEVGRLQAEIETERSDKAQAEQRVAELELAIERHEQQPRLSRPGTPMRNGSLDPHTPIRGGSRAGSPTAIPGSLRKTVGGLSFTQLYANYTEVQHELDEERRRTQKLSTAMDELMTEMETRTPEIVELKADSERLEAEVLNFSRMLDETTEIRDQALRDADRFKGQADAASREGDVLRQQLRDLSAQIKILLVEIQSRDQGLGEMSATERFELERAARGELEGEALEHMTSTGRLISERLVIFHNVSDLQAKNEDLLRITRQLGEQMEGEEAREKARQSAEFASENEELKQALERYKDELNSTATQIASYMKERDMFRRMLQHRGQLAPDADIQTMFGQSMGPPATPQRNGSGIPQTPRSKDVEDLNKLLKEQQTFFDQYRNESANDRRILKDQVDALAREKSSLQAEVSRLQSQIVLAGERHEMLQSNFSALRTENGELQKRSQQLSETSARQDLRTQQVAEELVEAKSMVESLRNENANAKAEKELWKRIENRLTEDNKSLVDERTRLNKLVADLQNIQNERELADSEMKRRLQTRTESLETEVTDLKRQLTAETEESKKASLRREYEESQNRTRIDDLVKSLGNIREELASAKTTRDQLQGRVDEMKIELRAAEEKVTALQPRPTPRFAVQDSAEQMQAAADDDLPAEQRLAIEVSELRRDLDLAQNDLNAARQQVEQYKSIAQTTEEELASFTETSEQYKEETEHMLTAKDEQIKQLQQRIEDLNSELSMTNNELSELRSKSEDNTRALDEQKAHFTTEIARLSDDAERHAEEKTLYQGDLRAQAEIAQQAQQSYEDELLKHAEAAKALQSVRKEYNELRTQVANIRAEADASKVRLESAEESWTEQRDRFENEMGELRRRRDDVDAQNKLLHQQLESFSAELASLRATRSAENGAFDADGVPTTPSSGKNSLQEVIKYLRREKEIVDVQYELSMQECKRLQQQLEHANSQLEETRQKLADERRLATDKSAEESSTNKLMQTINELNLFRESSVTLRNEARQAREKLEERSREIDRLAAELDPLKTRVGELEADLDSKEGEMKLLQDDRDHWRERTQNIISKYDRVDPAELEELKNQIATLKTENETLQAEQVPLRAQIAEIDDRITAAKEEATAGMSDRLTKFKEQAKEQNRKQNDRQRKLNEEFEVVRSERDRLTAELEVVQNELVQTKASLEEVQASAASLDALSAELEQTKAALEESQNNQQHDDDHEDGQVHDEDGQGTNDSIALRAQLGEAEQRAQQYASRVTHLESEVETLKARIQELESEVTTLQQQAVTSQSSGKDELAPALQPADTETLDKLKQELNQAQQEVEMLRSKAMASQNADIESSAQEGEHDEGSVGNVAVALAELRKEMEAQHALAISQMEEDRDKKIEKMKANLSRQLREEREKLRETVKQELLEEHSAELQKLRDDHESAVQELKAAHQAQMDRVNADAVVAAQKTQGSEQDIKTEAVDITEAQMLELVKTNPRMKQIVQNNIRKHVGVETEKLNKIISEKDAQIQSLKTADGEAQPATDQQDLLKQLSAAKAEKEAAVKDAFMQAEMKAKVQLSQRDRLQAQLGVVRTAAKDTPDEPVSKVWEVALKAKAAPKAAPAAAAVTSSSVDTAAAPVARTPEQIEEAKKQARVERFGTGQTTSATTGQANAAGSGLPAPSTSTASTFGLPSKPPQAQSQNTSSPNPKAPVFTPSVPTSATGAGRGGATGIPRPGGSGLPRSTFGAPSGIQQGIGRGGANNARGRGGGTRGGAQNAGNKRGNDGTGGGDDKRQKGGAPNA